MSMHWQMHVLRGNCLYLNSFIKQKLNHSNSRDPPEKKLLGQVYTENGMFLTSISHDIPSSLSA